MRNPAPINYFPPTLFSPNRSPIYGEAHFFAALEDASWGAQGTNLGLFIAPEEPGDVCDAMFVPAGAGH